MSNSNKTWSLEDVSPRAKDARYTFYLPSDEVISMLDVGHNVKLTFLCDVENDKGWTAERMWVLITEIDGDKYVGTLDNDPYYIPDLACEDVIYFEKKHIIQTELDDPITHISEKYTDRCFVTSSVLYDKNPVAVLYRETPTDEEKADGFSGWSLSSGLETESDMDNAENWHYVSLGAVLNIDDRFVKCLDADFDSFFQWNEVSKNFEQSDLADE